VTARQAETVGGEPGAGIVRVGIVATAAFAVVQVLAAAVAVKAILAAAVAVSLTLFVAGAAVYVWGFLHAVGRSREDEIDLPGLFLLADAPRSIRRSLAATFLVEVVVAFATAAARPFSSVAFGILVPLFGGALACLWAARYGEFPPRGQSRATWTPAHTGEDGEDGGGEQPVRRRRWFDPVDLDDEGD
jgi:hypothetical protein